MIQKPNVAFLCILLAGASVLSSCKPPVIGDTNPRQDLTENNLAGKWITYYTDDGLYKVGLRQKRNVLVAETLLLYGDGTYQQIFEIGNECIYRSPLNQWRLIHREDGSTKMQMMDMRYFSDGIKAAEDFAGENEVTLDVEQDGKLLYGFADSGLSISFENPTFGRGFERLPAKHE